MNVCLQCYIAVECLWKREIVWREVFVFLCCRHMYLLTHSRIFLFINIFFVVSGIYLLWRGYALRLSIYCACFDDFPYQIFRSGWNVVSLCEFQKTLILWMFCNISVQYDFVQFCIWFCAICYDFCLLVYFFHLCSCSTL